MGDVTLITPMQISDIPVCLKLLSDSFGVYSERARSDLTAAFNFTMGYPPIYYVARLGEGTTIVGLVGYIEAWRGSPIYDLAWLCVGEAYRARGIGRSLLLACLDDIGPHGTVMTTTDVPGFYARLGFMDRGSCAGNRLVVRDGQRAGRTQGGARGE